MNRMPNVRHLSVVGICLAGFYSGAASAAPIAWLSAADGDFSDGTNWSGGVSPGPADGAFFTTAGGAYTVTFTGNDNSASAVVKDNDVTWDLDSNSYALLGANGLQVRGFDAVTANLTIQDGTVTADQVDIGNPDGVDDNGTFSGGITLDNSTLSTTSLSMGGATATYDSLARLDVLNGSSVTATTINLNRGLPTGITVNGAGSSITALVGTVVGGGNAVNRGNISIQAGATANLGNFTSVSGGDSALTVTGGGSILTVNNYDIRGFAATGGANSLTIQNGAVFNSGNTTVGTNSNAASLTAQITGAGSEWNNTGGMTFGSNSAGSSVLVANQADVTVGGTTSAVADAQITVTGAGSTWTNSGNVGLADDSMLSVTNNGEFDASGSFIAASDNADIVVNTGGVIRADEVRIQGGSLSGNGTVDGNVINGLDGFVGTVSPGTSPGVLSITGDYDQGTNASLLMELGGSTAGIDYDVLQVGGAATLGGRLEIVLINSFEPLLGASFDLITATSIAGDFNTFLLPELAGELSWLTETIDLGGSQVYRASVVPLPASAWLMLSAIGMLIHFRSRSAKKSLR